MGAGWAELYRGDEIAVSLPRATVRPTCRLCVLLRMFLTACAPLAALCPSRRPVPLSPPCTPLTALCSAPADEPRQVYGMRRFARPSPPEPLSSRQRDVTDVTDVTSVTLSSRQRETTAMLGGAPSTPPRGLGTLMQKVRVGELERPARRGGEHGKDREDGEDGEARAPPREPGLGGGGLYGGCGCVVRWTGRPWPWVDGWADGWGEWTLEADVAGQSGGRCITHVDNRRSTPTCGPTPPTVALFLLRGRLGSPLSRYRVHVAGCGMELTSAREVAEL